MPESPNVLGGSLVTVTVSSNGQSVDSTVQLISISVRKRINMIPVARIVLDSIDAARDRGTCWGRIVADDEGRPHGRRGRTCVGIALRMHDRQRAV